MFHLQKLEFESNVFIRSVVGREAAAQVVPRLTGDPRLRGGGTRQRPLAPKERPREQQLQHLQQTQQQPHTPTPNTTHIYVPECHFLPQLSFSAPSVIFCPKCHFLPQVSISVPSVIFCPDCNLLRRVSFLAPSVIFCPAVSFFAPSILFRGVIFCPACHFLPRCHFLPQVSCSVVSLFAPCHFLPQVSFFAPSWFLLQLAKYFAFESIVSLSQHLTSEQYVGGIESALVI